MVWLDAQTQQCHVFSAWCLVKKKKKKKKKGMGRRRKMYLKEKN